MREQPKTELVIYTTEDWLTKVEAQFDSFWGGGQVSFFSDGIKGLDLDRVGETLIKSLELEEWNEELSLDENLARHEKQAKLEKEIARLEKLARAEKQPKKKFELVQQIKKMRNAELKMVFLKENIIVGKSKEFALRIIKLYRYLCDEKKEYILSKQLLRSGTSIGANVKEAVRGQSKPDFYAKMNISLKEAGETEYWLELLHESGYIDDSGFESIYADCQEIIKILVSITKTQEKRWKGH